MCRDVGGSLTFPGFFARGPCKAPVDFCSPTDQKTGFALDFFLQKRTNKDLGSVFINGNKRKQEKMMLTSKREREIPAASI